MALDAATLGKLPRWAIPAALGGAVGLVALWRKKNAVVTPYAPVSPIQQTLPDQSGSSYNDIRGLLQDTGKQISDSVTGALAAQDTPGAIGALTAAQQTGFQAIADAQTRAGEQQAQASAANIGALNAAIVASNQQTQTSMAALNAAIQRLFSAPVSTPAVATPAPIVAPAPGTLGNPTIVPVVTTPAPVVTAPPTLGNPPVATTPAAPAQPAPAPSAVAAGQYGSEFLREQLPGWQWIGNAWHPKPGGARKGEWLAEGVGMPVDYNPLGDTYRWEFLGIMQESSIRRAIRWAADMWRAHPEYGGQQALNFSMANLSSDAFRGGFTNQLGWNPAAFRYNKWGEPYNDNIDYANPTVRYGG